MTCPYASTDEDAAAAETLFASSTGWASKDAEGPPCSVLATPWPGSYRNQDLIQPHEGHPSVTFQRILMAKSNDRSPFPVRNPEILGNLTIVLVDHSVPGSPVVELTPGNAQPKDEAHDSDLGQRRPPVDENHHGIPDIVRYPEGLQVSPRLFLAQRAPP